MIALADFRSLLPLVARLRTRRRLTDPPRAKPVASLHENLELFMTGPCKVMLGLDAVSSRHGEKENPSVSTNLGQEVVT
jgi:hypothetical protein